MKTPPAPEFYLAYWHGAVMGICDVAYVNHEILLHQRTGFMIEIEPDKVTISHLDYPANSIQFLTL